MLAKKKGEKEKEKVQKPEEEGQEVIEVKTSKEPADKGKTKPAEIPPDITKESTISSFSQLESEEKPPSEEKKEEPEIKEPQNEKSKVEEPKEKPGETPKEEMTIKEGKEWIPGAAPEPSLEDTDKKISKTKIFIGLAIITVIAIIVGGVFYYKSKVSSTETAKDTTLTPQVTETTPTPTDVPEEEVEKIDYSEYSVSVLNGSGVPGESGNVKDSLEKLGFENVETGNAQSYDYETTEISLKADTPEGVYTAIEEALSDEYTVGKSETALDEDSAYDVIIIVGTKK